MMIKPYQLWQIHRAFLLLEEPFVHACFPFLRSETVVHGTPAPCEIADVDIELSNNS